MGEEVGYMVREIDLDKVESVRKAMPCLSHVRKDLY